MQESPQEEAAKLLSEGREHMLLQRYQPAIQSFEGARKLLDTIVPKPGDAVAGDSRALEIRAGFDAMASLLLAMPDRGAETLRTARKEAGLNEAALMLAPPLVGDAAEAAHLAGLDGDKALIAVRDGLYKLYTDRAAQPVPSYWATSLRADDLARELVKVLHYDIPLAIGDCRCQLGADYAGALKSYTTAAEYPLSDSPVVPTDVWLRMARVCLARGDVAYRAEKRVEARASYDLVVKAGTTPSAAESALYKGNLAIMVAKVRTWLAFLKRPPAEPGTPWPDDHPAQHLAMLATILERQKKLDVGADFFGHTDAWKPVFSFTLLREVARTFAQIAAQANREYISYTQRAEDQTQNVKQLEQAAILNATGVEIEKTRVKEASQEAAAAKAATDLATRRAASARQSHDRYRRTGWEVMELDALIAWSSAAAMPPDDDQRQMINDSAWLGVSTGTRPRSDRQHELARLRGQRVYSLELDRLNQAIAEQDASIPIAVAQERAAETRQEVAQLSLRAAEQRSRHAAENLELAKTAAISPELLFEFGAFARQTAQIYLERAIEAALHMQAAYCFENNTEIDRIRKDYGDLAGVNALYAADFLMRDIDAFLFEHVTRTTHKSQLIVRPISLRSEFPMQFLEFLRTGVLEFQTRIDQFHEDMPGTFNARIKRVAVDTQALGPGKPIIGQLSCGGVSLYRKVDAKIRTKVHPIETMILPPLQPERTLARLDSKPAGLSADQLEIFENVGVVCSWRLDVPLRSNDFDLQATSDVTVFIAYLCEHDPTLEGKDRENLPKTGERQIAVTLRDMGADANEVSVFKQLADTGEAKFVFPSEWFARSIKNPKIQNIVLTCAAASGDKKSLTVRFWADGLGDDDHIYRPDAARNVTTIEKKETPGPFAGRPLARTWNLRILPAENSWLVDTTGKIVWSRLTDIGVTFTYSHEFAGA